MPRGRAGARLAGDLRCDVELVDLAAVDLAATGLAATALAATALAGLVDVSCEFFEPSSCE